MTGTGWKRFAPANETGEARSPKTGSVSTRTPSISSSIVLCPSHVTRRPEDDTGVAHVESGLSSGSGARGTRSRRPKMNSPMIFAGEAPLRPGPAPLVLWNLPSR